MVFALYEAMNVCPEFIFMFHKYLEGKENKGKFSLLHFDQQMLQPQYFVTKKHSSSLALITNRLISFAAFHFSLAHLKVNLNCGNKTSCMSALSITYNTTLRICQFENAVQNHSSL